MAVVGIVGPMRSGKTLFMTMLCYREQLKDDSREILANYHLNPEYAKTSLLDPNAMDQAIRDRDTSRYDRSIMALDEVHTFLDSRNSGQKRNRMLSYFITQSGKLKTRLFWTSQFLRQVDVRLRLNTQTLYMVRRFIYRHGRKRFLSQEDERTDFHLQIDKYRMGETADDFGMIFLKRFVIKNPSRFFALYDTLERVYYQDTIEETVKKRKEAENDS